ncbi:MAG: hypothetical protein JWM95_4995 [Gemmatimonadetes bacterium]|nr:hypothetical protein [Gemmatimonadota bacterium]
MATPRKHYDELIARNEQLDREARSETFRDLVRTAGHLLFWVLCGMGLLGLGLHSTDLVLAPILWLAGQTVWIAGVSFSLLAAYRRGAERGDWR